ncbi:hypothetical protein AUJ94_00560 [bacterium CG2_30_40_12]|nr:MAG: hypothetical protein AUJ94_00560 [bacterium CG2_30_40_12]
MLLFPPVPTATSRPAFGAHLGSDPPPEPIESFRVGLIPNGFNPFGFNPNADPNAGWGVL